MPFSKRRKSTAIVLLVLALILLVVVFWPRERVVGGLRGGPIGPGEMAYREEFRCVGLAYDFCPDWPDYGCDYLCFGVPVDRQCFIERYELEAGLVKEVTACR